MKQRLFTFLSAVALVLCLASCALWVRSYQNTDMVPVRFAGQPWRLATSNGWVQLDNQPRVGEAEVAFRAWEANTDQILREMSRRHAAYLGDLRRGVPADPPPATQVPDLPPHIPDKAVQPIIPLGLLASATAILPTAWVVMTLYGLVRRRNRRFGLCPTCGYDLRATPDRCPECGAAPKGAAA